MFKFIKRRVNRFYHKNLFFPSNMSVLVNPFWLCRRALAKEITRHAPQLTGKVLDFGCGSGPYKGLLTNSESYLGLEYDTPENRLHKQADIFYDGVAIPLESESIDGILSTQTLEHVPNPDQILGEWFRVLRPGGKLLLTVPCMWPEHEAPYDFQRYTSYGLSRILEAHGFETLEHVRLLPDCRAPIQLFQAWLYDVLNFGARKLITQCIITALFFAPLSVWGSLLACIFPKVETTYMDNIILAQRR